MCHTKKTKWQIPGKTAIRAKTMNYVIMAPRVLSVLQM